VAVSLEAAGETFTDEAFVTLAAASAKSEKGAPARLESADGPLVAITWQMMLAGLGAAAVAGLILVLSALGVFNKGEKQTVEDRVAAYSRKTKRKTPAGAAPTPGLTANAVGFAQKALEQNRGFEAKLGTRLEAAGMSLKPAEWLLVHAGIAVGLSFLGLLMSSGSIVVALLALFFGLVLPWVYLSVKHSRRVKAFNSRLADTLQLMSGSLSAGLSLAQSVDTVVREGLDPIAAEFRRALVEARLGVDIEDALDSVAERMRSRDFHWVVMAIRIQREVGGNLAELLLNVAETIREREYLARQVKALSAEGRLSVWILGGLPPAFMAYLTVANPEYLHPLVSTMLGWLMLGAMAVLLTIGVLWMKKVVKVEV
jgi:tight adherence protein B